MHKNLFLLFDSLMSVQYRWALISEIGNKDDGCFSVIKSYLGSTLRNEFISLLINSMRALGRVQKDRFNTEKQQKGRKKAPVRGRLPRKQGLKRCERQGEGGPIKAVKSGGEFQEPRIEATIRDFR